MSTGLGSIYGRVEIDTGDSVQKLQAVGRAVDDLNGRGANALSGLSAIDKHSQNLTTVGQGLLGFGAILTGVSVIAGKTAMDFEAAMSAVSAVSGATAEQMERAEKVVLDVGYQTTMSATEAAAALEILIRAGVDLDAALDGVLMSAVNLAEATGVDIVLASETAAAAMNIFGYNAEEAARVVDAISQSANASALDVNDWSLALKYAGPVVAALGWDIEDLAEMMVILGDAGIKGEVGATAIRNILLALSNPTAEITSAFEGYGVALFDTNGNLRSMKDITTDLVPAWQNMTQAEKLAFAELVAGKQGVTSFTALMEDQTKAVNEGSNSFDRARKRMEDAGTTSEMAQKRMDNLAGSMEELKGTVETLMISFMSGLTPVIRWVTDALSGFLQLFLRLPGPIQTAIAAGVAFTGILAMIGGGGILAAVKIAELALAWQKLGGLVGVTKLLTSSVVGLRAALMGLMAAHPILLLLTAAAGAMFLAYKTNVLGFADIVDGAIGKLQEFWRLFGPLITGGPIRKDASLVITTTADNVWDTWQQQPDGSWKNATLGITATADDTALGFINAEAGEDGNTRYYTVVITSEGELPGEIVSSSRDPNNPTQFFMTIELDTGETVNGVYDEISGKFTVFESTVEVNGSISSDLFGQFERLLTLMRIAELMDPFKAIQRSSDATMRWLQRCADPLEDLARIVAGWTWDKFQDTSAFEWVSAGIKTIRNRIDDLQAKWGMLKSLLGLGVEGFLDWAMTPIDAFMDALDEAKEAWTSFKSWISGDDSEVPESVTDPETGVTRTRRRPRGESDNSTEQREPSQLFFRGAGDNFGKNLKDAANQMLALGAAASTASPHLQVADQDMNKIAASAGFIPGPVTAASGAVGSAGVSIGQSTAGMALGMNAAALQMAISGANIGGTFGTIATTVAAQSLMARTQGAANFAGLQGAATGSMDQLLGGVTSNMTSMASTIRAESSAAQSAGSSALSGLSTAVTGHMLAMRVGAGIQMAMMAMEARTQGDASMANLVGALSGGMLRASATLMQLVSIVSSIGAQAAGNAYAAGANISSSFAAGMLAYLGVIMAAAAAMVAAADAAVLARARISSPSKMAEYWADMIAGRGFVGRILHWVPKAGEAMKALVQEPTLGGLTRSIPLTPYGARSPGFLEQRVVDTRPATVVNQYHVYQVTPERLVAMEQNAERGATAANRLGDRRGLTRYNRR